MIVLVSLGHESMFMSSCVVKEEGQEIGTSRYRKSVKEHFIGSYKDRQLKKGQGVM